jgi:hypothetical protein
MPFLVPILAIKMRMWTLETFQSAVARYWKALGKFYFCQKALQYLFRRDQRLIQCLLGIFPRVYPDQFVFAV